MSATSDLVASSLTSWNSFLLPLATDFLLICCVAETLFSVEKVQLKGTFLFVKNKTDGFKGLIACVSVSHPKESSLCLRLTIF